jgi:hypothetical protein
MDRAMSLFRIGRICSRACRCEYEALQTLETCELTERIESKGPKIEILSDILTTGPEILMLGIEGQWCNRCWVPKRMASDLLGLRQRPL